MLRKGQYISIITIISFHNSREVKLNTPTEDRFLDIFPFFFDITLERKLNAFYGQTIGWRTRKEEDEGDGKEKKKDRKET